MISCLLIQILHSPQGIPVRRENVVSGETLQIGRGAGCAIHLPDHRVALLHAEVRRGEDGALRIAATGDEMLKINGFVGQSAILQAGVSVEVGGWRLRVEAAPQGHDLALAVERIASPDAVALTRRDYPVTLDALGFSRRKLGLALAACILLVFVALPALRWVPGVAGALDAWQAGLSLNFGGLWSPGPLAGGHALFEAKCSACHKQPFQPVTDAVCTGCHQQPGNHLADAGLQQKVSGKLRCTACHADHQGAARLQHGARQTDRARCVSCHGDIRRIHAGSKLDAVRDFSTGHPAFHLTLREGDGLRRQPLAAGPLEQSGLKYSHKVHLDKAGVATPEGDTVMQCRDCHKPDAAGEHFLTMSMEHSCQQSGCHRLDFAEPLDGRVPHGSEAAVMSRLRESYAAWLAEAAPNQAVCAPATPGQDAVQRMQACAHELARQAANDSMFGAKGQCRECHEIATSGDAELPWKIAPLHLNRDWQPAATFPHVRHGTMKCTDCHDKVNSQTSADVSMPDIGKCRSCHAGEKPALGKLATACDSCHRFHREGVK